MSRAVLFRRLGLVGSVLVVTAVLNTAPAGAAPQPQVSLTPPSERQLTLTPASGPAGTTVTVRNKAASGECGGLIAGTSSLGFFTTGEMDLDVTGGGDEIPSTDPQFESVSGIPTGGWSATFTVPAGLAPGQITVTGTCTETPSAYLQLLLGQFGQTPEPRTFPYAPAVFTVTGGGTGGGGTGGGGTTGGGTTGGGTGGIPGGSAPVPEPSVFAGQAPIDSGGVSLTRDVGAGLPITGFGALSLAALGTWVVALGSTLVTLSRRRHRPLQA